MEYVDNPFLSIKSSNLNKNKEEIEINISQNCDKIFENSFGKFKINLVEEINDFNLCPNWKCNIYIKELENIKKKKERLWLPEINGNSLGYTYDEQINTNELNMIKRSL